MTYRTLRRGDIDPLVRAMQGLLYFYGHLGLNDVDRIFGLKTQNAVQAFQKRFDLHADGVVGKNTWSALLTGPLEHDTNEPVVIDSPVKTGTYGSEVKEELERLWQTMLITDEDRMEWSIHKARQNQSRYQEIVWKVNPDMPWWFVAIIHDLEAGYRFDRHLHNGDPLSARTVQVPRGRPVRGNPPFTWEESAYDALTMPGKAYDRESDWSIPAILWRLEGFNGYGYRLYRGINSPYLWAGTNHYEKGKYTSDGHYDPDAVSKQAGAAGVMFKLGWSV